MLSGQSRNDTKRVVKWEEKQPESARWAGASPTVPPTLRQSAYLGIPVEVHDLHATMLHLLGIGHKRLTLRVQGRDFRLTDVHGRIVQALLAQAIKLCYSGPVRADVWLFVQYHGGWPHVSYEDAAAKYPDDMARILVLWCFDGHEWGDLLDMGTGLCLVDLEFLMPTLTAPQLLEMSNQGRDATIRYSCDSYVEVSDGAERGSRATSIPSRQSRPSGRAEARRSTWGSSSSGSRGVSRPCAGGKLGSAARLACWRSPSARTFRKWLHFDPEIGLHSDKHAPICA